jgi:hypothetical protein
MRNTGLIVAAFRNPQALADWDLREWDLLLRQLRQAGMTASLHARLDELGLLQAVPEQAARHLEWAAQLARRHKQSVLHEVAMIRRALCKVGVPVVLLKGAAYVMAGLPASRGRIFSDIDILVPAESLNVVESELMIHGWHSTHHDVYDQRYYRSWMHELPPMTHTTRGTVIDVHHAILPVTARLHPDSVKLLQATVMVAGSSVPGRSGLWTLAPADMVLHSALHLFYNSEFDHGFRDLVDIHNLLQHFSSLSGFWTGITARAQELELARPLFYALRYATLFFAATVPPEVMSKADAGKPNAALLALMDSLFERALQPDHPECGDRYAVAARFVLYLRGNWLRMPPLLLMRHLFQKAFISDRKPVEKAQCDV